MKTKLVIHIGVQKTATTSIQKFFSSRRSENLEKYGLLYPSTRGNPLKHNFMCRHAQPHTGKKGTGHAPSRVSHLAQQLYQEVSESGAKLAMLSEEGLSTPATDPRVLTALSSYFDVIILVLLRRQDLFAESLYGQYVKRRGETRGFVEFVSAMDTMARMDYLSLLRRWEVVFGVDAIRVIPFEQKLFTRGLIETILDSLNIPVSDSIACPYVNVSPGREAIEVMRAVNQCYRSRTYPRISRANRHLWAMMQGVTTDDSKRFFSRVDRRAFLEKFEPGNAEIAGRYLNRVDGVLFADSIDNSSCPDVTWYMPERDINVKLAQIVATFTAGSGGIPEKTARARFRKKHARPVS